MTPERILDYYPSPVEGGVLELGQMIYCRGKSSVSLLERVAAESSKNKTVVKVTAATKVKPPYTKARIEDAVFFTMFEDWEIEPMKGYSVLTKTWRDLKQYKMTFLPMKSIVRVAAKKESKTLVLAWNAAASKQ